MKEPKKLVLQYPTSIKSNEYCFKVNTDDFFDCSEIKKHLTKKGISFTKSLTKDKSKLIAWHVFKIKSNKPIKEFIENVVFCQNIFLDFNT